MPKTPDFFQNKTILITGAGNGIGRAAAIVFAREGANVVCTDLNIDAAERASNQVIQMGSKAIHLQCDVTERKQVENMVKEAIAHFGAVSYTHLTLPTNREV